MRGEVGEGDSVMQGGIITHGASKGHESFDEIGTNGGNIWAPRKQQEGEFEVGCLLDLDVEEAFNE